MVATSPKSVSAKLLIAQAVDSLNVVYDALHILREEMIHLASLQPKFDVIMAMHGAGETIEPQLMAEIGDVCCFAQKGALAAFASMDAPAFPVHSLLSPAASPSVACHICAEASSKSLAQSFDTLTRIIQSFSSWTKKGRR